MASAVLRRARSSSSPVSHIFEHRKIVMFGLPGAFPGICSQQHVPTYVKNADNFKDKGIDTVICVSVNDPYTLHAWQRNLELMVEFFADIDGTFIKSLGLDIDLSNCLLGVRSKRWSANVQNGIVNAFNIEEVSAEVKVSGAEVILKQI